VRFGLGCRASDHDSLERASIERPQLDASQAAHCRCAGRVVQESQLAEHVSRAARFDDASSMEHMTLAFVHDVEVVAGVALGDDGVARRVGDTEHAVGDDAMLLLAQMREEGTAPEMGQNSVPLLRGLRHLADLGALRLRSSSE
jgi:hypothetical protein